MSELVWPQRLLAFPTIREQTLIQVDKGLSQLLIEENVIPVLYPSRETILQPTLNPFQSVLGQPIFCMYLAKLPLILEDRTTAKETGQRKFTLDSDICNNYKISKRTICSYRLSFLLQAIIAKVAQIQIIFLIQKISQKFSSKLQYLRKLQKLLQKIVFHLMSKCYRFQDFQILETIDSTHQGKTKIYLIKYQNQIQVCKAVSKTSFIDAKSVEHIKNQKQSLLHFTKNNVSGFNHLISTFQDQQNLYMLLELVEGLPLHKLLQMSGPLNQDITRLIVTQVGLIMRQLHKEGYIYRDIKASNFIINSKGKITMIDLGKAKKIGKERTFTVCGTTHSMPPQVYEGKGYSYEFDYYSFGVLIYELLTGSAPFGYQDFSPQYLEIIKKGLTEEHLQKIRCPVARDLIKRLMQNRILERLGSQNGFDEILEHDYFNCAQFCDYMDILQDCNHVDKNDERFLFYVSEIQDFGLQFTKYDEVTSEDPFYKFYELEVQNKKIQISNLQTKPIELQK